MWDVSDQPEFYNHSIYLVGIFFFLPFLVCRHLWLVEVCDLQVQWNIARVLACACVFPTRTVIWQHELGLPKHTHVGVATAYQHQTSIPFYRLATREVQRVCQVGPVVLSTGTSYGLILGAKPDNGRVFGWKYYILVRTRPNLVYEVFIFGVFSFEKIQRIVNWQFLSELWYHYRKSTATTGGRKCFGFVHWTS